MIADRTRGIFYPISKDFSVELIDTYYDNQITHYNNRKQEVNLNWRSYNHFHLSFFRSSSLDFSLSS
jgi:hypothetical protein